MDALPRYTICGEQIEAFPIMAIEFPDIGVRLCGPGIKHGVRRQYLHDHRPHVGGYYMRISDGQEFFLDADEFERYYKPASRPAWKINAVSRQWPALLWPTLQGRDT